MPLNNSNAVHKPWRRPAQQGSLGFRKDWSPMGIVLDKLTLGRRIRRPGSVLELHMAYGVPSLSSPLWLCVDMCTYVDLDTKKSRGG